MQTCVEISFHNFVAHNICHKYFPVRLSKTHRFTSKSCRNLFNMINPVRTLGAFLMVIVVTDNLVSAKQSAALYAQPRSGGNFVTIDRYYQDLSKENNGQARSTCVKGVWLFYSRRDFCQNEDCQMEYYYHVGNGNSENCVDFRTIYGRVYSARYAGYSDDPTKPSLTVYARTYFTASQKMLVETYYKDFGFRVMSIVVTGNDAWTIYSEPEYRGKSRCIHERNSNYVPEFIPDTSKIDFPYGVRSVRSGCWRK